MKRFTLRLKQFAGQFWFIPALMTLCALLLAEAGIKLEERHGIPAALGFIFGGSATGARSLLQAIASSSIGVAGTVFSITIASLSFAAGNMGPRLLDNFTRDRGNQVTLGIFIATFAFTLYTLRVVSGSEEYPFVPHYNVTMALLLALACIVALVYLLAHVTRSINITRVVNLLRDDLREVMDEATQNHDPDRHLPGPPPEAFWQNGERLHAKKSGYLQLLDIEKLTQSAEKEDVALRLYVRPGDYVFPNSVVAVGVPRLPDGVLDALTLGNERVTGQDLEYTVRQLAEVAARALSPGTNDPVTANDVIDRFGDALCRVQDRHWPDGTHYQGEHLRLVHPVTTFKGLTETMFREIRQYGKGMPSVMIHLLEVLTRVASCLSDEERRAIVREHVELIYEDARRVTENSADLRDLQGRYEAALYALDHPGCLPITVS